MQPVNQCGDVVATQRDKKSALVPCVGVRLAGMSHVMCFGGEKSPTGNVSNTFVQC